MAMMVLVTATAMVVQRVSATTRCSSSSSSLSSGLRSASRSRLLAVHGQMLPVHPRIGRQLRVVRRTVCINSAGRATEGERNATTNAAGDSTRVFLSCRALPSKEKRGKEARWNDRRGGQCEGERQSSGQLLYKGHPRGVR